MLKKTVIILSLILWPLNLFLNFNKFTFATDTVFRNDYQGEQLVLRNIHLYPTPLFARVFQNKPRIYFTKYMGNFFALTDLNNYFFALHPEPISGNVNMFKYPFLDILFFLIGVFYFSRCKYKKVIFILLIPLILILSCLKNFEGLDFLLWFPLSLIITNGIEVLENENKKVFTYYSIFFILFAIPEAIRCFFNT